MNSLSSVPLCTFRVGFGGTMICVSTAGSTCFPNRSIPNCSKFYFSVWPFRAMAFQGLWNVDILGQKGGTNKWRPNKKNHLTTTSSVLLAFQGNPFIIPLLPARRWGVRSNLRTSDRWPRLTRKPLCPYSKLLDDWNRLDKVSFKERQDRDMFSFSPKRFRCNSSGPTPGPLGAAGLTASESHSCEIR